MASVDERGGSAKSWVPRKINVPEIPISAPVPVTLVDVAWNFPVVRFTSPCTFAVNVDALDVGVKTIGPLKASEAPTAPPGVKPALVVATV